MVTHKSCHLQVRKQVNEWREPHRVVDHIVGYLAATGVDYIFGVDGANIEDLYDAAHFHADITAILAKHEFSAATMADGYSRSGAGLGVVAATSGGGCLNTVAGLGEALASRVPVLALIGQPPTSLDGRGAFQDTSGRNGALNGEALFSAVSVFCRRIVTPEDIVSALPEAVAAAKRGGPAVLLLPKDIQQSILDFGGSVNGNTNGLATVAHLGDPQVIARRSAKCRRPDHDHRRRAGRPRRRARRVGTAAFDAAGAGGDRPGRERRRGHAGTRIVVGARSDRCDGPSRCRVRDRRQRAVPAGRYAAERDRAWRAGRRAGIDVPPTRSDRRRRSWRPHTSTPKICADR